MTPNQRKTLIEAEATFRRYGDLHAAKPDPVKAASNYALADQMAVALAEPARHIAKGTDLDWQAKIFHAEMDKLGVPRDDGEDFYSLWGRVGRLLAVRTSPAPVQEQQPVAWEVVHKAVCDAVEKCKSASGMHRAIEMYVNTVQITHDALGTDTAPKIRSLK